MSVVELQRAWRWLRDDRRRCAPEESTSAGAPPTGGPWRATEDVVIVLGAHGLAGTSTMALALASVQAPARVLDCGTGIGLAAAGGVELGDIAGWSRSQRSGGVVIERAGRTAGVPPSPDRVVLRSVLDLGVWSENSSPQWAADLVRSADALVACTTATVPGLRALEAVCSQLGPHRCVAVVRGPLPRRWPRVVRGALGSASREVLDAGGVVTVPHDGRLAVEGVTPADLPRPVVAAAEQVLELLDRIKKGTRP